MSNSLKSAKKAAAAAVIALCAGCTCATEQTVVSVNVGAPDWSLSTDGWESAGASHFTGKVVTKAAFRQGEPARSYGAYVTFSPGARTFWHMHPLGQTLIVTLGIGLTQAVNPDGSLGPVKAVRAGDVVVCPPDVKHWHGASPESAMTHLAISESDPIRPVVWEDAVSESIYAKGAVEALKH